MLSFDVDDSPTNADIRFLEDELYRFNAQVTGIEDGRLLSLKLHDERGIAAGLFGHTWGGVLEVKVLWVREDLRGRGHGTAMLRAAEEEAIRRGCFQAVLGTHSFQAPEFYRRHGYEIYAELTDYPRGYSQCFLRKYLRPDRT